MGQVEIDRCVIVTVDMMVARRMNLFQFRCGVLRTRDAGERLICGAVLEEFPEDGIWKCPENGGDYDKDHQVVFRPDRYIEVGTVRI